MLAQIITSIVILIAFVLILATRLRPVLIALIVLILLGLGGVVDGVQLFSGFSSSVVITILGISIISIALQQTGVAYHASRLMHRIAGNHETLLILMVVVFSAGLSLFMNNIAAVGVLLPAVMSLAKRSQTPPSRLLIPLAFGTILGGMATLLTTSNLIVSAALKDAGLQGFGLLDFFPVGAPVIVIGTLYLITLGRRMLPQISSNIMFSDPSQGFSNSTKDSETTSQPAKFGLALGITALTLGVAAFNFLPIALIMFTGAVLLLLTGCIDLTVTFQRIEWQAIFLIAGMWPLSIALRDTGLAAAFTALVLRFTENLQPLMIAAVFLVISMLFTQIMSGPVTPIVITPLALAAAQTLGIDPRALVMAVALGCSLAFISPVAHPVNALVMIPGGYRLKDFFKVGAPLTLLGMLTILAGLHFIWGL